MAQHDLEIANQTFIAFRSDLNSALEAIATLQSGATAPATTYGGMPWIDTTEQMLKFRNVANDGWINAIKFDLVNDVVKQVGQTIAPNGSVSQPSYTFDSDGDTGIYRKGTNSMGFGAGGTERMVVKSAGVDMLGTVTAPTATAGDSSTKVATTAYVQAEIRTPVITTETLIHNFSYTGSYVPPETFVKHSFAKTLTNNKDVGYFRLLARAHSEPTDGAECKISVSNDSSGSPKIFTRAEQYTSSSTVTSANTTSSEVYAFLNLVEDPDNSSNWAIWVQETYDTSNTDRAQTSVALAGYM